MASFNDMDFGDRKAALVSALSAQGITAPLPVQTEAVPRLLSGGNLVVQAPTGTGKTLAYLLPALARIDAEKPQAQAVVLAPTYELAMQIAKTAQELATSSARLRSSRRSRSSSSARPAASSSLRTRASSSCRT